MDHVLPDVMTRARRGLCPTCGAALALEGEGRDGRCGFCGTESTIERRLRAVEPEIDAPDATPDTPKKKGATRWLTLHGQRERCNCPGCGSEFETDTAHAIQRCPYCGAESKLETRLRPISTHDVPAPQCRTRADLRAKDYPWRAGTEQLIWRVLNEPDLEARRALSNELNQWRTIDATLAHFLPWLLEGALRDDDVVALSACDAVGKLLCSDDTGLHLPVLQACDRAMLQPWVRPCLLDAIGLGPPFGAKSLLDAAQAAHARGNRDLACHALWNVNTLVGRNFPAHPQLAEVFIYRMFYLDGPVLGWAMYYFESGFHNGYRHDWRKLLRHIDEFAIERPAVIPSLRHSLYTKKPEDDAAFLEFVDALEAAASIHAKAAAASLLAGWDKVSDDALGRAVTALEPLLDDEKSETDAVMALVGMIRGKRNPPGLQRLVAARGEGLPDRLKREYNNRFPDVTPLDKSKRYPYMHDPKIEPDPEMAAMMADWKEGIKAIVEPHRAWQRRTREIRDAAVKSVDPPLFLADGPPTLPS